MPAPALPALDFELLFAALPAPFAALAPDGTVLALNAAMTALLGPAVADGLRGQPVGKLRAALAAAGQVLPPASAWAAGLLAAQAGPPQVLAPDWAQVSSTSAAAACWEATLQPVRAPAPAGQAAGELRYLLLRLLNVTEQRHSAAQLAAQQQRTQRILDQLPLTISTMEGPELAFTFLSARARASMGPRVELGRPVADSLPEIVAQGYVKFLENVRDSGQPIFGHEERSEVQDPATGELRERYNNYGYLPLHGEQGTGVLAYGLDVTEQVQARLRNEALQAEARDADQRLRRVTESLPSITFITSQENELLYVSPQWYAYTGTTPATLQQEWPERLHPDDRPRVWQLYQEALALGTPWHYELRLRGHDGEYRWFMSRGVPEPLEEARAAGRPRQWFGSNLDVHELRETQRLLEAKDRQLSQILSYSPALIATVAGPDHRFTFVNAAYDELMSHRARVGQPAAQCLPEVAEQGFVLLFENVYKSGKPFVGRALPLDVQDGDGDGRRRLYLDFSYVPLPDAQGRITGILAFGVDVTQQVLARQETEVLQAQVRAADTRLRRQAEVLPIITFTTDATGRTTYMSPQWYAFTGQKPGGPWEEVDAEWADRVHPDDRQKAQFEIQASINFAQLGRVEVRLRGANGQYRWFLTEAVPELNAGGQLRQRYGFMLDVHELHERTEELARSRADFAALADNIAQLAWMADATGHIFWYNQQWYDYTGTTLETIRGAGWMQAHDPALVAEINARYLASIQAGQPWEDTFPLRRADGRYRWFLSRARPIRDEATGEVVRWFGTNTDVTELRQLQTQLGASEEELRIQAESIPQQVWTARPDGTVDFYNHRTAAYVGVAMEKNGAAHWLSFVHPDDHALMQERWNQAIASQRYYEAEFRLRRYDGEYRWFLGQAQARRTPGGRVVKWYGTNTDVHQQRALQEQLLSSQARFQQLLETLPQMAWTVRPDGVPTYFSQRWYDYTGATTPELQELGWEEFVHPDDLAGTLRNWHHSLTTGLPFEDETRWRDRHGNYRWFLVRAEAIRDKAGDVSLWVGAHTDVHEAKQVQKQLEAQNARLMRSNEDLDNFVYTASHDLKQPINNMAGIFEELTRTAYFRDPDAVKLIAYFERALGQIFKTIDDLSAIVRVQRQQQEVPAEEVALAPLADEIIASLQDQVAQYRADFELDFATCPVVIFVRPNLQSLLFNLISNSLKYAAPDRPARIRISCSLDVVSGRPVLTVQDNGLGIDLERFGPQLFQLFRRFHTHVDGTGMGLYLANRIVQNHGGRMEVSSTVDEGTTFQIYL